MTGQEPKHRDWIKLWIKESLLGTIREDLTAEERSVWYDFLLLAGNCRTPGVISANATTPIPDKRIASILNIPEALVKRCIKRFIESGRIEQDLTGVIHIINWEKYQYSDYDRVKKWRQGNKDRAITAETPIIDPDLADLNTSYEKSFGQLITRPISEKLSDLREDYTIDSIKEAMNTAILAGKRSMKYVEGILRNQKENPNGNHERYASSGLEYELVTPEPPPKKVPPVK
jgi:DnaD/phage-associated family protein